MHSSHGDSERQLHARLAEDGDRRDAVRGRRSSGAAESKALRNGQVSAVAHHRMDPVRDVEMLQLEDGDAEAGHQLSPGVGGRSGERDIAGSEQVRRGYEAAAETGMLQRRLQRRLAGRRVVGGE